MNKKLLYRTQRIYLIYFVVIIVITAPLFYFIIHRMYISNADESLRLREYEFKKNNIATLRKRDIPVWNKYNPDVKILEDIGLKKDSLFYAHYYETQDNETELYRELNTPVTIENTPFTLSARVNLVESQDLILGIAAVFLAIIVLLLVGLFFINKKLSGKLWKPFYQTLQKIEDFEIDKQKRPVFSDNDIEEFNRLNNSINDLIEKNILIYNNQKEFIENAAHELQTPIAVFKAKIDTLIQRPDVTKEQSEVFASLYDSVSRLSRLNKNLLLLSRIDRNRFDKTVAFSLTELIKKQLAFFTAQAEQKQIEIITDLRNDLTIHAHQGLTEILVNNLLLNAIRHNVRNGKIYISVTEKKLEISNTGELRKLPSENLFGRFFRSGSSGQGTGLGLAIVKKIVDLNNWKISYSFIDNLHHFSVHFG